MGSEGESGRRAYRSLGFCVWGYQGLGLIS